MSDADVIYRWMTQAELDQLLSAAREEGALAMRERAAAVLGDTYLKDSQGVYHLAGAVVRRLPHRV